MRVLVIESDPATAQSLELILKSEGMNVYTTDLGEEGVDLAKLYDYDVILTEFGLSDMTGLSVVQQIRGAKIRTPIMAMSQHNSTANIVRLLSAGADDFLAKPFARDELVARVHAIVRRSKGHAASIIEIGDLTINLDNRTVETNGQRLHLTGKEYQAIELLALRHGSTMTKEMLLNHMYGGMDEPELKIVDVFICKLRKKMREAGLLDHIETIWGRGYVLRDPHKLVEATPAPERVSDITEAA